MASTSIYFDEQYYLQQNPDVAAAVSKGAFASGQAHFNSFGRFEQRDPNAFFDTSFYLGQYPDVAASGLNPFQHFLQFGSKEFRAFNANQLATIDTDGNGQLNEFNVAAYRASNPDVAAALDNGSIASAYQHFVVFGQFEGRTATLNNGTVLTGPFATGGTGGGVPNSGTTFTLTTNTDAPGASSPAANTTGTAGNDTYNAVAGTGATFSAGDQINGGAGQDTLRVVTDADFNVLATNVTNVETLSVTNVSGAGVTAAIVGTSAFSSFENKSSLAGGNVAFTGAAVVNSLTVSDTTSATTVTYTDAGVVGTTDVLALKVSGAGTSATAATINVNSVTNDASGVERVNISSTGTASNIVLNSNDTALTNLTITGAAALTANVSALGLTTIDASAASGGVTINNIGVGATTATGGAGDDTFSFGANLTTTDVVNGGAGNDFLGANGAVLAGFTAGSRPTLTSIEGLAVSNDVGTAATTIDASVFGAISNVRIADQGATDAAAVTFNGLTAAATGSNIIRFDGDLGANTGSYAFNITNATTGGVANAVTLDMRGGATTATSTIALAGVETLTINTANATGAQTFNVTDAALQTLTVLGKQSVDLDAAALGTAVTTVDASGLTGTAGLSVALSTTSISGATVTGGNGVDNIVGTQLNDVIKGGEGADFITGGAGADTLSGGAGADTFTFAQGASGTPSATNFDTITDFGKASDIIDFTAVLSIQANGTSSAGTAAINAEGIATFNSADVTLAQQIVAVQAGIVAGGNTNGELAIFQNGSDSYIFVSDGVNGVDANDVLIKLTGVTGLSDSTIAADNLTIA